MEDPADATQFDPFESKMSTSISTLRSGTRAKRSVMPESGSLQSIVRRASLEFPLGLGSFRRWEMVKGQRLSVETLFPLASNWNGFLYCSSVSKGNTGFLSGRLGSTYRLPSSVGEVNGAITASEDHKEIDLGYRSAPTKASRITYGTYISAPITDWEMYNTKFEVSLKRPFAHFQGRVQLTPHTQTSAVALSLRSNTIHQWSFESGWTHLRYPYLGASISPVHKNRNTHISCRWTARTGWNWGLNFMQRFTNCRLSSGVSCFNRRLTWIITWSDQDLTIRIPIRLDTGHVDSIRLLAETVLLSGLSEAIHSAIFRLVGAPAAPRQRKERGTLKTRREASRQQEAMESKATLRTEQEELENGLVIINATYFTSTESLDVSIPLQFWVLESKLDMPAISKASFLGFCALEKAATRMEQETEETWKEWVRGAWDAPKQSVRPETACHLTVKYRYRLEAYQITVGDDDELSLPSPNAHVIDTAQVETVIGES